MPAASRTSGAHTARVEGGHFAIPRRAIERDRLVQVPVGLEADRAHPPLAGQSLELLEQPAPEPEAACRRRNPHSLQLGRATAVELQSAATDGLSVERRDDEEPGGRAQLLRRGGDADRVVEAVVESARYLGEVLAKAECGFRTLRVDDVDTHEPGGQQ